MRLPALEVKTPKFLGNFQSGQRHALGLQRAEITNNSLELENQKTKADILRSKLSDVASIALGSMGGKLDGEVDPKLWEQGMDYLESQGSDVSEYRDHPELAQVLARGVLGVQQQLELAKSDRDFELALATLDQEIAAARKPVSTIGKINQDYKNDFISKSERDSAVAKANSSKRGITITHPDGTTTVIGGSGNGLGKSATNQLQTGIIQNHELLDLTDSVRESFQPEFLTYQGQGEGFFTRHAEKLGMDIGAARKQFLKDRTQFVTKTERLFNAYRKEITGAAAAVQELDRLKKSFLNVDQSPSEFEATLDSYQAELKRTIRLRNKLLREGLDPRTKQGGATLDNLFLTGVDDDVEERGRELEAQGLSENEIMETLLREGY